MIKSISGKADPGPSSVQIAVIPHALYREGIQSYFNQVYCLGYAGEESRQHSRDIHKHTQWWFFLNESENRGQVLAEYLTFSQKIIAPINLNIICPRALMPMVCGFFSTLCARLTIYPLALSIDNSPPQTGTLHSYSKKNCLNRAEIQVLSYMLSGMKVPEIAARLQMGVKTISFHKLRALQKLDVPNINKLYLTICRE